MTIQVRIGKAQFEVNEETAKLYEPSFREKLENYKNNVNNTHRELWQRIRLVDYPKSILGLFKTYSKRQNAAKKILDDWKEEALSVLNKDPKWALESLCLHCSGGAMENEIGNLLDDLNYQYK